MDGQTILLAVLAMVGSGGIGAAVVNAISNRRRLNSEGEKFGAEATKIITDAAAGTVTLLEARVTAVTEEREREVKRLIHEHNAQMETVWGFFARHTQWDMDVVQRLQQYGVTVQPPPPLPEGPELVDEKGSQAVESTA